MPEERIWLSEAASALVREMAALTGLTPEKIVAEALERYRRALILEETNAAYARMRDDPQVWREEMEDREAWEATLGDGLADE